ncbi:MAG: restriction endonuclease subunit S [Fusobacteriaceae bacterium]
MKNKAPKLRFPEFSGDWEEKELGNTGKIVGGGTPSTKEEYYWKGSIPWISSSDLSEEKINKIKITRFISEEAILNSATKLIPKNSILIVSRVGVGKVAVSDIDLCTSQDFANLTPSINYNSSFLANLIKIKTDYLLEFNQGTSIKGFLKSDLESLNILIPHLPEQEKIASFLSRVDIKIEKLEKKKDLLSQYKKGMMQKLFSQKLRFKDENGNDYPDWEEKKLGEIGFFQTSSVDKLYVEGENEVKLVNYMNVYRHEKIDNNAIKNYQIVTAKDSQIQTSNLLRGDILFTPSSETPEDIGHSVVIFENLEKCVFSYHLMRFRPNIKLDILYSHYFCNNKNVLNQIIRLATGSTRFTISVKSFSSIEILLPYLQEQEKIANFLSSIDRKIELVDTELERNKEFKNGLLQQMFV